jgi:hypothetical protein
MWNCAFFKTAGNLPVPALRSAKEVLYRTAGACGSGIITMTVLKNKKFLIGGIICFAVFLTMLAVRLDLFDAIRQSRRLPADMAAASVEGRDSWLNIYQSDGKIGYAHRRLSRTADGFAVEESVFMRLNTMGMVQHIHVETHGQLLNDFSLQAVQFRIRSGRFSFSARGKVSDGVLEITTDSAGSNRNYQIRLPAKPYLAAGLFDALHAADLKPGDFFSFDIFDPVTMGTQPIKVSVIGPEDVHVMGTVAPATKIMLNFKGANQFAWLDNEGEVLQEKGLLGMRLEKTSRRLALADIASGPIGDLTAIASVASNVVIERPASLQKLAIIVDGIDLEQVHLEGGRQVRRDNRVTIVKEDLNQLAPHLEVERLALLEKIFLQPSPFIQSDHPAIRDLVESILGNGRKAPLHRARLLLEWVYKHIEKRPVLSLPDALTTLENKEGDCNEHAVLLAAMARAAGIPARVETGLVYLNGRFYYHAWNLLYLGKWVTADAVYNQLPADVTHIRFTSGSRQQSDLMGVLGRVRINVVDWQPDHARIDARR